MHIYYIDGLRNGSHLQRIKVAKDEGYQTGKDEGYHAGKAAVSQEVLVQAAPPPTAPPPSDKEIESKVKGIMSKVYQQLMSKFSKKNYPVEEIKAIIMTTIRVSYIPYAWKFLRYVNFADFTVTY